MIKKIFFLIASFIILNSCSYEPVYSKKNFNFTIGDIKKEDTSLNNKFVRIINSFSNKKNNSKINIEIKSKKEIFIKSKNTKGDPLVFELIITLEVININKDEGKNQKFSRKITYKNSDDKFKLKQYEKELEKMLIIKIVEDLISNFSKIQ